MGILTLTISSIQISHSASSDSWSVNVQGTISSPPAVVQGSITDELGTPIQGATVSLLNLDSTTTTTTDTNGIYTFLEVVPNSGYTIQATKLGHEPSATMGPYTFIAGQTFTVPTIQLPTIQVNGIVYWRAGFETGDFYEITDAGYGGGGEPQTEGVGGQLSITSSNVFKGNYACKTEIVTPPSSGNVNAKAIRWDPIRDYQQAYYGAALYLDPNLAVTDWGMNIMQLHVMSDGYSALPAVLLVTNSGGSLKFNLYQQRHDGAQFMHWTGDAIVGEWFTAVFYCNHIENGNLKLWINGVLVADVNGDFRTLDSYPGSFFDAGIYQSYQNPAQYVLVDEMIVASTLESATPIK